MQAYLFCWQADWQEPNLTIKADCLLQTNQSQICKKYGKTIQARIAQLVGHQLVTQ